MASAVPEDARRLRPPATPSRAAIHGHPLHPMLVPFPIAFLVGAVLTDLGYIATGDFFWARGSLVLVAAGTVTGAIAAAFGLVDYLAHKRVRSLGAAKLHFAGNAIVIALSAVSWWLRTGDAADAVVPAGIVLSVSVALILLFTGWLGGELAYRHRVGTIPAAPAPAAAAPETAGPARPGKPGQPGASRRRGG